MCTINRVGVEKKVVGSDQAHTESATHHDGRKGEEKRLCNSASLFTSD